MHLARARRARSICRSSRIRVFVKTVNNTMRRPGAIQYRHPDRRPFQVEPQLAELAVQLTRVRLTQQRRWREPVPLPPTPNSQRPSTTSNWSEAKSHKDFAHCGADRYRVDPPGFTVVKRAMRALAVPTAGTASGHG